MANKYKGWSSHKIEKPIMLDRNSGFVGKELEEEFDRRCTEALDGAFEGICARYPNLVYPRGRRKKGLPLLGSLFNLWTHPKKSS